MKIPSVIAFSLLVAGVLHADPIRVASVSPLLTEIAEAVGGSAVRIIPLVTPEEDPHEYRPTPQDLKEISGAQLILASGKNLEHYLDVLRNAAGPDTRLLPVGDHVPSLELKDGHDDHDHGPAGEGPMEDPHWWHSVPNVIRATEVVRDALIQVDPGKRTTFEENAAAYIRRLKDLDSWIKLKVAELPRNERQLVTSHDAFQYFASTYGFRIHAIEGINPEQEPSAKEVSDLIKTIRDERVKAIFLESNLNPKVSRELTRETGVKIGGMLAADGLGTGESSNYEGMMRHNVTTIVNALSTQ